MLQVAELADAAHGFVAADLAALCSEAALVALRRVVAAGSTGACVSLADFRIAETLTRPSAMRELAVEVPKVRQLAAWATLQWLSKHGWCARLSPPRRPIHPITAGLMG